MIRVLAELDFLKNLALAMDKRNEPLALTLIQGRINQLREEVEQFEKEMHDKSEISKN